MSKDFPTCPYCGRSGEPVSLLDEIMEKQMELRTELAVQADLLRRWLKNEINHVFQNTTLQEDTKVFLKDLLPEPEAP